MTESLPRTGYYDGYIVQEGKELKELVMEDWDGLIYVCGRERTGKTTFAAQFAKLLDPTFSLDKMCWTAKQFKDLVMSAKQYDCIVLDEAYLTFASIRRMDQLNSEIIGMLTMIGKKNLFIIIVAPVFWGMSEYLIVHRSMAMFHIYSKGKERGFWELYGYEKKMELYYKGKQHKSFKLVGPDRRGGFGGWLCYDKDEYDRRKDSAIQELQANATKNRAVSADQAAKHERQGAIRFATAAYINGIIVRGKKAAACSLLGVSERTFDAKKALLQVSTYNIAEVAEGEYTKLLGGVDE